MVAQVKTYPLYFAPDLDPSWEVNPGILTDVANLVPTKKGTLKSYICIPASQMGTGAFAEATYGNALYGRILKKTDGTARLIVGTTKRLMEYDGSSTWTDRSVGATDYTTTTNWDMASYGNVIIAVSKENDPQASSSGAFAALGGSPPKARHVATNKLFVMLADYNDGTDYPDGWACSALGDHTSWAASISTQAARGRLLDTPGKITDLVPLRDAFVAYKEDSIYIGEYALDTTNGIVFAWRLIADGVGCASTHGVAVIDGVHYFQHRRGIYKFDGSYPQNIGHVVNNYWVSKLSSSNPKELNAIHATVDDPEGTVYWFNTTSAIGLAYNYLSNRYGYVSAMASNGTARGIVQATTQDLVALSSSLGTQASTMMMLVSVTGSVGVYYPLIGTSAIGTKPQHTLTTGDIGNSLRLTTINRVGLGAIGNSSSHTHALTVKTRASRSATLDAGTSFTYNTALERFDGTKSGRYHRLTYTCDMANSGSLELTGIDLHSQDGGAE